MEETRFKETRKNNLQNLLLTSYCFSKKKIVVFFLEKLIVFFGRGYVAGVTLYISLVDV